MRLRTTPKTKKRIGLFGLLVFVALLLGISSSFSAFKPVYAVPNSGNDSSQNVTQPENNPTGQEGNGAQDGAEQDNNSVQSSNTKGSSEDGCKKSLGPLGWIVCPVAEKMADAADWVYSKIEGMFTGALQVNPAWMQGDSTIRQVWEYIRILTNAVFIVLFLVVIYSQLTGYGISNYGIKKVLPKVVLVAVLINLSFLICALAIDVSNVIGNGLQGLFSSIEEAVLNSTEVAVNDGATMATTLKALVMGAPLVVGGGAIAIEYGMIWMLIPTLLGGLVSVIAGLITITLRQAVVALLVMISPLAFVAYMLPNTEDWFKKWKKLLTQMLVFYPAFGLLFGASNLAAFAIRSTAIANQDAFWLVLSLGVQVFPLLYSVKLMKMSGTFLGDINARMQRFAEPMLTKNREWADSHRQIARYESLAWKTPLSALRRKVGERRALRSEYLGKLTDFHDAREGIYVSSKFASGYDGAKAQGTEAYLKPNKYTEIMKDAAMAKLDAERAAGDTANVISNYGNFFVSKKVRDKIKAAEEAGDADEAKRIQSADKQARRAARSAEIFLEYDRVQRTLAHNEEADTNFAVANALAAWKDYDPNDTSGRYSKYRHFIVSAAGGLGEVGQARVLGSVLRQASSVENAQRRDISIVAAKFPHDKRNFRNMFAGYYINDDGYATDEHGNILQEEKENGPGYLLNNHPERLVKWDKIDEQGRKYYDWYDGNRFVTRIYENDGAAFKELFSTYDATINDPINNIYGVLAGMEPGAEGTPLEHIGLSRYRTTIGRAVQAAKFKEKNAAFGPMVAEMVKKGYIKNYAQMYLAYLDNLGKGTTPGGFNKQDAFTVEMFARMMDPDKWPELFPENLIRDTVNVNGELISGYRLDSDGKVMRDSDGKPIKVANDQATYAELMACIKEKYLYKAAQNISWMMTTDSPDIEEQRKHGTVEKWKQLAQILKSKWGEDNGLIDPYEQKGDMRKIRRDIEERLYDGTEIYVGNTEFHNDIDSMFRRSMGDSDGLATGYASYCIELAQRYPEKAQMIYGVMDQLNDYIINELKNNHNKYPSTDAIKERMHDLIDNFLF